MKNKEQCFLKTDTVGVKPISGFEFQRNSETGETYPFCCQFHKEIYGHAKLKFPSNWNDILVQVAYTEYHFIQNINEIDWYYKITDYVEYNAYEIGNEPSRGLALYYYYLKEYLNACPLEIPSYKKEKLLNHYETVFNTKSSESVLESVYQEWLKLFPFEVEYLKEVKPIYDNAIMYLTGNFVTNQYNGNLKLQTLTKSEFINKLKETSSDITRNFNSLKLFKDETLYNANKLQLNLLISKRELQLKNTDCFNESNNKASLKDELEKWLNDEMNFLQKLAQLSTIKDLPPQQSETVKPDEVKKELHNHIFKDNAFEVFERYHKNKSLAENSKTDLSLLFQLFQNDKLFVETVELKHYIRWLNKTYGYGLTELRKANIKTKPNIQRTRDYKEYKRTTLKQP